ncbi:Aste57867_3792 [Aphanomyces stellatus]|uniref:Aste57867_3792 protein n=1 Tax=Aphanomyces stellatus TaxID=120398 RepID=A0A485KBC8_9STRA|nr:hypothetical protein As57867_003781 [Aphanomyces stellatus]VFT80942.1 Aste57867_3792 [Aphanomyces stellatus]
MTAIPSGNAAATSPDKHRHHHDGGGNDNNTTQSSSAKNVKARMQSKKDIQDGLRMVLKSTIELTAILQEQLYELQHKGWNCAVVEPHHRHPHHHTVDQS